MKSLSAEIVACFPIYPVPSSEEAVANTYMVEHLHEILGGRRWDEITPRECRKCDDGFSLLTARGFHYYLPDYLMAEIIEPDAADTVIDLLIQIFQGPRAFYFEFWQLMTVRQIECAELWVSHYEARYPGEPDLHEEVRNAREWLARIKTAKLETRFQ